MIRICVSPPGVTKGRAWYRRAVALARYVEDLEERAERAERRGEGGPALERSPSGLRWPTCEGSGGKRRFGSANAARRAAGTSGRRIRAYRCPACHGWHQTKAVG